jgi:cytochrome c553
MAAIALGACLAAAAAAAQSPPAPAVVASKCESCHGRDGNTAEPNIPRLNGQRAAYLTQRLKDFLDPGRQDPHATAAMWSVVQSVDDDTLKRVAEYYAHLKPMEPKHEMTVLAAKGRALYLAGNADGRVPACRSCHGPDGEGSGAAPRLAGQRGQYLRNQLERLRLALRASDTMHMNANSLSDENINSLVAYLARD